MKTTIKVIKRADLKPETAPTPKPPTELQRAIKWVSDTRSELTQRHTRELAQFLLT